ncbi:Receptor-type tyrosine-protein phosphatase F [Holothuria leucospilota]|uniref:protein-tyrosine-phosphatase n=1 Tax=Holothuria leucospilota TaxID=206669 RepID=A0A9Q1HBU7_HOLLE|nr:Receptor-type tyrosine-protein phosphatase F [Holothuria leucospilota]
MLPVNDDIESAVEIRFVDTTVATINEGQTLTRSVCHDSSVLISTTISFSLSASPGTLDLIFPTNPSIPAGSDTCTAVTIRILDNSVREDTRTFQISLASDTADVNENQGQFLVNVLDDDSTPGGTVCPTPTVFNSSPVSCNSFSSGSVCVYDCDSGFERLSGDASRTCTDFFRWSGSPLFCISDNTPPTVSNCPAIPIFVYIRAGQTQGEATWTEPTAADASGSVTVSQTHSPGDSFLVGATEVRYEFKDSLNNMAECSFTVSVFTASIQCPSPKTISPGEMLSYNIPQCMSGQGSSTASCSPSAGSSVTTDTSVTCTCPQDGSIQCSFQIFVDCLALVNTFCMNPGVSCDCMDESCDPGTGICSSSCTVVNTCSASVESKSLSQVNPSSSVNINCTLRGSTTILQSLQLRLSSRSDSLDETGITRLTENGVNTGDKFVSSFRVESVTKEETLFCVLFQGNYLIGGVSVKNFVHELPVLSAAPISDDVSNTSITIIWRAWDPAMDDGEPPVLAYIPYYRMDASDEWISGPMILTSETLQFKADNLKVDTLYEFSVAAVREGENGEGRRSPSVKVKTLCNVPDMAASVNVQLTSTNKVNVSWQLPPGEVMCSTGVTSYKVYYRIEGSIDDTPQLAGTVEDVDTRWFIVDDRLLQPESSYIFFVTVTTDQESGFRESQAIEAPADTSGPVYLISLIIIPILLIALIVVFIIIRRKIHSKAKKATKANDGEDTDYVNAAMADDPEDYISLEEQSRTVSSSKYEDLNHKPQVGVSIPPQYEVTIIPEPQKPVATPRYHTRNMKGVNSGAYEDVGAGSEKRRQLPDVPQSHPSGDEDEENNYIVPDRLEEYTGVYINIKNKGKIVQPGPIKVAEFQNFMSRNKEDVVSDIVQQFMALPSGGQYPWSVALKFQNKPRNFFKTILAYDHSRVKLDTNGSDARSDYINASYIKNQQGKTSFIAAQGPQEGTVDDFWKMVWQENVETIVMVTDNIEKNKLLCCTYWPKKVHMSEVFDNITVLLIESISYTTHTIRKLNLLKGSHKTEVHTVTQIQVHSWPYGSVPKEPASLISIIKKVKSLQTNGSSSPLLVHCSNGVGATGTFIAVYVLMDTVKKNKDVNIFDFVKNMRDERVDMVQTRVQYLFIFECLQAVLQSTDSQISCDQLKKLGHTAIKLKSRKEYKVLQESVIAEHFENYDGNSSDNQHKNRFINIIPEDMFRPVLKSEGNTFGSNSYINAIHLTDFSGREFIMTQTPLSSTVEDFWRLVYDYECTTIVMLNTVGGSDETVIRYWPGGAHGSAQYGLLTVECKNTTERDLCIHTQFQVAHKKGGEKSVSVDHFAFCGWSGNQPDVSKLQQFIRYTGNKSTGPVLVHCINGVGLSAVYVIVKTESERLEQEGSADVFQCLTKLRKICPLAIQTQEEYTLCYQLLKDHLDNPEEYAVVY